ncbi:MAG: AtpZ/AtpI family protein [Pirellulaceae bacterium]|nr:AtpZ/AtpI family protein [Planctomycetales bacterium]
MELEKNLEDQGFNDQGGRGQGFGDPHFGEEGSDDRSSEAMGYSFASLGISIALEMVVPGVLGYLLDRQLGFRACFVLVGFGLGFGLGMWHLVKFAQRTGRKSSQ